MRDFYPRHLKAERRVISSAYSIEPACGSPLESCVIITSRGIRSLIYSFVASPSMLGFIAKITSEIFVSLVIRENNESKFNLSGVIPAIGEIAPPSTNYNPRYTPVRSMESISK